MLLPGHFGPLFDGQGRGAGGHRAVGILDHAAEPAAVVVAARGHGQRRGGLAGPVGPGRRAGAFVLPLIGQAGAGGHDLEGRGLAEGGGGVGRLGVDHGGRVCDRKLGRVGGHRAVAVLDHTAEAAAVVVAARGHGQRRGGLAGPVGPGRRAGAFVLPLIGQTGAGGNDLEGRGLAEGRGGVGGIGLDRRLYVGDRKLGRAGGHGSDRVFDHAAIPAAVVVASGSHHQAGLGLAAPVRPGRFAGTLVLPYI